jgi:hypothetical protein
MIKLIITNKCAEKVLCYKYVVVVVVIYYNIWKKIELLMSNATYNIY